MLHKFNRTNSNGAPKPIIKKQKNSNKTLMCQPHIITVKIKILCFFTERKKGGIYHKYKQKEVMPVRLKNKTVLVQKFKESLAAVLPITLIVFVLCFYVVSVPSDILMAFVVGAVLLNTRNEPVYFGNRSFH